MFKNWLGTSKERQDPWYVKGLILIAATIVSLIAGLLFIAAITI